LSTVGGRAYAPVMDEHRKLWTTADLPATMRAPWLPPVPEKRKPEPPKPLLPSPK